MLLWDLHVKVTGNVDSITSNETVVFTGLGLTTVTYDGATNTVSISGAGDGSGTLRFSVDGTQTFVKFNGDVPSSVNAIPGRSAPYAWEQMINILSGVEWSSTGDLS